jgi:hypothetical protein
VKNQTFFFSNVEARRLDQSGLATISPANVDAINAKLAASGYPGSPIATGLYPNPVDSVHILGKIDHQLRGNDLLTVRYSLYDVEARNARGAGALNAPTASSGLDNRDQAVAFANTLTISPRTVIETRAQFAQGDLRAQPTDPTGPAVSIAGVATFGTLSSSPTARLNRMYQAVNNVSHQSGAHALRGGIDILVNDDRITFPRAARGAYAFSSLGNFLAGVYNNSGFTQTFGESVVAQSNPNVGVFAQDEWRAASNLTINLGIRYDLQFLETIATDSNNIAPRAGFAWTPFGSTRTVIRGSTGLFYDRVPLRALANALLSAGNTADLGRLRQVAVSLSPAQAGAPAFPNILSSAVPTGARVNLTTMDPSMRNAYSNQASVEIEREIGAGRMVSAGYQYVRGRNLIMAVNQNVPSCVASGANNGCRPDPAHANNNQYSPVADSNYHGLHVSLAQRASKAVHYRVSYTLSKSMNNVGENFFSSPIDPFDLSKDWGRSDDDQRHRLVLSGAIRSSMEPADTVLDWLTHGYQLSGMLQAYSALPFNVTSGVATIQGTPGRPVVDGAFIPRNAGEGSAVFNVNLRVSRSFDVRGRLRAELLAEAFNVTNRANVVTRNTNFGPGAYPANPLPTFGQVTAVAAPRSFQLALRMKF